MIYVRFALLRQLTKPLNGRKASRPARRVSSAGQAPVIHYSCWTYGMIHVVLSCGEVRNAHSTALAERSAKALQPPSLLFWTLIFAKKSPTFRHRTGSEWPLLTSDIASMAASRYLNIYVSIWVFIEKKHVTNVHATELKAVGIAIVKGKINNRTCIWKNATWQSRKHTM